MTHKALSVRQPWADYLLSGAKWCENRGKRTHVRGRILIHSSAKPDKLDSADVETLPPPGTGLCGHILGSVELYDCINSEDYYDARCSVDWDDASDFPDTPEMRHALEFVRQNPTLDRKWACGPWLWLVRNPVVFKTPVPASGKLGFWLYEGGIE